MNINPSLNKTPGLLHRQPIPIENLMPAKDRWVLVLTPAYRCLAFQEDGVWRDVAHGRRINDRVVSWMPVG